MNDLFQQYKNSVDCKVEFTDDLKTSFTVATAIIVPAELEKKHYNRAKVKREWKKEIDEVKQPTKNSELSRLSVCKTNPISVELI